MRMKRDYDRKENNDKKGTKNAKKMKINEDEERL